MKFYRILLAAVLLAAPVSLANAQGQIMVQGTTTMPVSDMVTQVFIDNSTSIDISNVQYTGYDAQFGVFTAQPGCFAVEQGIVISTGTAGAVTNDSLGAFLNPEPANTFASNDMGGGSNPLLNALGGGAQAYDAATISFDFVPRNDTVYFRYVFASEEYPEFVMVGNPNGFNDIFGLFIEGPGYAQPTNMALLPGGTTPVSINNVNDQINTQYYLDGMVLNFLYDGFTIILEAKAPVQPCQTYTLTLAIQDVGDAIFDSAIFLEALSFNAGNISHVDMIADESLPVCDTLVNLSTNFVSPQYDWSPATGLSSPTVANPVATYTQPIQYVLEATLSPNCIIRDSISLYNGPDAQVGITATDDLGAPITAGTAFLIDWDTTAQSLALLDADALVSGNAALSSGGTGYWFAKAAPDSLTYPNLMPTYAGNVLFVQNATPLPTLGCGDSASVTIECVPGQNPGGTGFISGFISQGANKTATTPIPGLPVFAMDASGQPLAYRITDADGYFAFNNLPVAPTSLFVDHWGIQNTLAPSIPLTASQSAYEDQQFLLHSTYLEWAILDAAPDAAPALAFSVYPNPANDVLNIRPAATGPAAWQVLDATGRTVLAGNAAGAFTLDVSALPAGAYAVRLTTPAATAVQWVVVR